MASSRGLESSRPSGGRPRIARDAKLRRAGRARRAACQCAARAWAEARRSRRHHREELRRIRRDDPRHLARRLRGGAGERQAAWPRARLHPRTFRRARLFRDAGPRRGSRAVHAREPRTADRHRQRQISRAVRRRLRSGRAARRRRPRLAVLHLGHHGPPERRDAHAPQSRAGELCVSDRSGFRGARRFHPACRADEPRLRALHDGARGAHGHQRGAGVGQLRAGRDLPHVCELARHVDVRRAHDGEAAGRFRRRRGPEQPAHHRVGRRADVCRGCAQGARPLRAAARADLRAGRKPDDHHGAVAPGHRGPRASALAGAARLGRAGPMRAST